MAEWEMRDRDATLAEIVSKLPKDHGARFEYDMLTHRPNPSALERIAMALEGLLAAYDQRPAPGSTLIRLGTDPEELNPGAVPVPE